MTSRKSNLLRYYGWSLIPAAVVAFALVWTFTQTRTTADLQDKDQGTRERPHRVIKPDPPSENYIGSESCRACHTKIWDLYQTHPMSNSSARTGEATAVEDFERGTSFNVSTPIGEVSYRVEQTAEGQFHHESLTDPALGTIYDQQVRVEYSIGSGRHGRSYAFANGDCYFMSPITWYTQDPKWDLSPNYRPEGNPRFERRILQGCLTCHMERVKVSRDAPHRFPASAVIVPKIGCESCHGPGAEHVAIRQQQIDRPDEARSNAVDTIVNPSKLDFQQRESICWECHFPAEQRYTRYGRLDSDFRPGMHFDDVWVAIAGGAQVDQDGAMRVASHVEQSLASTCSQRSNGRFGCLSCHDAHTVPAEADKETYYRQRCLNCHQEKACSMSIAERLQTSPTDSCVSCHMPTRELNRVPHTTRTDHRIRRNQQAKTSEKKDLSIFSPSGRTLPRMEQERAMGLFMAKLGYLSQDPNLARDAVRNLSTILPEVPDDTLVLEWLGVCEQLLRHPDRARQHWNEILEKNPNDEGALRRLADLALTERDLSSKKQTLTRFLEVNPWQSDYQLRLSAVYGDIGDLDQAAHHANHALNVNPTLANAHRILAEIMLRQGKRMEAEKHQKLAERLTPKR